MENENVSNQYSTKKNKKNNYRNINNETNKEEKYAIGKENVESKPTNKEDIIKEDTLNKEMIETKSEIKSTPDPTHITTKIINRRIISQ